MDSQPTSARRRTYAEWYVWSRRNLTNNTEICHAAAQAATEASEAGADPATAARGAAQSRAGAGWMTIAEPAVRGYAEWYDWSRTNLLLAGEPLHVAAAAAIESVNSGGDATAATNAARGSSSGAGGTPTAPPIAPPPGWQEAAVAPPPPPPPPGGPPSGAPFIGYAAALGQPVAGHVILPLWVAILLGIACGMSFLIEIAFVAVIFIQTDPQTVLGAIAFSVLFGLMFAAIVLALVGILRRAGWARAMTIIAGVIVCLSCAGIVLGLPVIIGAATAGDRG